MLASKRILKVYCVNIDTLYDFTYQNESLLVYLKESFSKVNMPFISDVEISPPHVTSPLRALLRIRPPHVFSNCPYPLYKLLLAPTTSSLRPIFLSQLFCAKLFWGDLLCAYLQVPRSVLLRSDVASSFTAVLILSQPQSLFSHNTWNFILYSSGKCVGSLTSNRELINMYDICEMGPTVYSPYPSAFTNS